MAAHAPPRRAVAADAGALTELQFAAYAENRAILGVVPLPLRVDYAQIRANHEVWLVEDATGLSGALILEPGADDMLIWSVATAPRAQGSGLGNLLLAKAEERAMELGRKTLRLYTGERLVSNIAWYGRHGYAVERIEKLADRNLVHMIKTIG
jgi:ribosomal protein S18 acetylase RimI-like enzyme